MSENEETKIEEEKQTDKKKKFIPKMYDKVKDALKKKTPLTDAVRSGNAKVFNSMDEYKKHLKLRTEKKEKLKNIAGLGVEGRQTHLVKDDNFQKLVYGTGDNSVSQRLEYAKKDPDFYSKLTQYGGNQNQREFDMFHMWKSTNNPKYKPDYLQDKDKTTDLNRAEANITDHNKKYTDTINKIIKTDGQPEGKQNGKEFTIGGFKKHIDNFFHKRAGGKQYSTTDLGDENLQLELVKYIKTLYEGGFEDANDEQMIDLVKDILTRESLIRKKLSASVSTGTNNAENQAGKIEGGYIKGADGKWYKIVE